MSQGKKLSENDIISDILEYGRDILVSDIFRQAEAETHHLHGTVFDHTVNVCVVSMRLCSQLTDRGIQVNKKDLIQAALCHDLGMVGRETKYKGRVGSWRNHARESARIARELVPDLSAEAEEMILSHMWPVSGMPPRTNEGMILCMADKYATMADWRSWLTKSRYAPRIKEQLDELKQRQ